MWLVNLLFAIAGLGWIEHTAPANRWALTHLMCFATIVIGAIMCVIGSALGESVGLRWHVASIVIIMLASLARLFSLTRR